jgi:hypothetical protein
MAHHYSQPGGFVGRNICYAVLFDGRYYGGIVGGSATKHLPGRAAELEPYAGACALNNIVNNIFFHIEKDEFDQYPIRNFAQKVLMRFLEQIQNDWREKYGDLVMAFESLVELPRTGEVYRRAGFRLVGQTKGFTCKRAGGKGTDSWSGRRVWDTTNLRPKHVFVKLTDEWRFL